MAYRYQGNSNLELVDALEEDRLFREPRIRSALLMVPRGNFVPPAHAHEAHVDRPLHIPEFGFNISAPHMYAIALTNLDLGPGQSFLDVGSGCGHMTALAGMIVGSKGSALGIDISETGIKFASRRVQELEPKGVALQNVKFEQRNVFLRDLKDRRWDRIHCGASCGHKYKHLLYELLNPGGVIITPIGAHLVKGVKDQFGFTSETKLMNVRYGELQHPTHSEILENERLIAMQIKLPQPQLSQDYSQLFNNQFLSDVVFQVENQSLYAHKAILVSRCEYFSALYHTGMKDAESASITVTDYSFRVFKELLRFIYTDKCEIDTIQLAGDLIPAAEYYRIDRLKQICAHTLAQAVNVENSCQILEIACVYQSPPLKKVAFHFILGEYEKVSRTKGFRQLKKECLREVLDVAMHRMEA